MDTSDLATLNDALGSAGVDLRVSHFALVKSAFFTVETISGRRRILAKITRNATVLPTV
jgi:hypothetical protein